MSGKRQLQTNRACPQIWVNHVESDTEDYVDHAKELDLDEVDVEAFQDCQQDEARGPCSQLSADL